MRRITKNMLLLLLGILFTYTYCEFFIYYVVIAQCYWPTLHEVNEAYNLKALLIADTHLLGPYRGHWLDKWRREFQMQQAFLAIITLYNPEVVFVLGDLFDEGEWSNEEQFQDYVDRFFKLFALPESIKMYVVAGNHDIGFHHKIRRNSAYRFENLLRAPSVQHIILKGNNFVLINSMALHGDSCDLCVDARKSIANISDTLNCAENPSKCKNGHFNTNYSRPIIMQHFPLYRLSDAICTEPDSPPLPEKNKRFRIKIDALSEEATRYLVTSLKPRAVFGGHTHHGCLLHHSHEYLQGKDFWEYSIPSFSWRNRPDPKFMLPTYGRANMPQYALKNCEGFRRSVFILASISPDIYSVAKCGLPKESTIALTALMMLICVIILVSMQRKIGRSW